MEGAYGLDVTVNKREGVHKLQAFDDLPQLTRAVSTRRVCRMHTRTYVIRLSRWFLSKKAVMVPFGIHWLTRRILCRSGSGATTPRNGTTRGCRRYRHHIASLRTLERTTSTRASHEICRTLTATASPPSVPRETTDCPAAARTSRMSIGCVMLNDAGTVSCSAHRCRSRRTARTYSSCSRWLVRSACLDSEHTDHTGQGGYTPRQATRCTLAPAPAAPCSPLRPRPRTRRGRR
jgi:hypothetical protein